MLLQLFLELLLLLLFEVGSLGWSSMNEFIVYKMMVAELKSQLLCGRTPEILVNTDALLNRIIFYFGVGIS
jgi:hypothetical protein